ncbi:MAG: PD-(D/E)XK nuclease family protein, partial [Vampirovibrionia bacterium]
ILNVYEDINQENNNILENIQTIIDQNPELNLSEIAILTRTNPELETFADLCQGKNIPYQICRQKDLFALKPAILVYLYLKALENPHSYSLGLFGLIAHPPFGFDAEDYTFLTQETKRTFKDFISIIRENIDKHNWKNKPVVSKFITAYDKLKAMINDERLSSLIIHIINETGILEHFANQENNKFDNILSLKKLIDEVKNFETITKPATLTMLLAYIDDSIKEDITLELDQNNYTENAIQLLTIHKSKGRQFSYVFMNNLTANKWEKRRGRNNLKLPIEKSDFSKESEAIRLLFVGCSRSKHYLSLSYSSIINNKNTELSTFIHNAANNNSIVEVKQKSLTGDQYIDELITSFTKYPLYSNSKFKDDLKVRAEGHIMSPSSMFTYHTCPKQFLYRYIYRIPVLETINKHFSFGNAVHKALEKYIKSAIKVKQYAKTDQLIKYFNQAIEKETFNSMQERSINQNRGVQALNSYYARLTSMQIGNLVDVEVNLKMIPFDKYLIKGIIDLISINEDKTYTLTDYKTGNKSTTKSNVLNENGSHRHYLDQIQFYKVLFENKYPDKKANKGVLMFVEKPENSIHIDITEEDKNNISEKMLNTFKQIHNLEFTGVDEEKQQHENCKNCDYKMLCKLNTL